MCEKNNRKIRIKQSVKCGKSGFTLVELCVVLALLAILSTMIATFSVLMSDMATESKQEYDFLEDCAKLKEELCHWSAENDTPTSVFTVNNDGTLTAAENNVSFSGGVLLLGEKRIEGLDTVEGITFSTENKLIKCVAYRSDSKGKRMESSFVFSLRAGAVATEEVTANE